MPSSAPHPSKASPSSHSHDRSPTIPTRGGTRRPITLTVDGKPEAILQDPTEYQGLRNLADLAEENEAIRLGIEDMHAGRTRPLDEVFDEMREKYAIPR
jgi:PHD/YefM family antitoxin component YafN of YafNO toxin-antitoxin module